MKKNNVRGPLLKLLAVIAAAAMVFSVIYGTLRNTVSGSTVDRVAEFTDATGLRVGDDVRIAGVKVGRVDAVRLNGTRAEVAFSVRADQPVFANTRALIRYQNLIGQRYLALRPGTGASSPLPAGERIPLARTEGPLDLTALLGGFQPLFTLLQPEEVNKLATVLVQTLQGEGPALATLLQQISQLSGSIAERDQLLGAVLTGMSTTLEHLAGRSTDIEALIGQSTELLSTVNSHSDETFAAIDKIDKASGSLAGLLRENRGPIRTDLVQFNKVAGLFVHEAPVVEGTIKELPPTLAALARISSYGSWANLYACSLALQLPGTPAVPLGPNTTHSEVCR
ncbi:MCE family protein [Pseudonocardiaceae bacterium YIM PH 21723]|nr:MCE family protein [Pseudonocardiaceae bacterium YIM PH 21723]